MKQPKDLDEHSLPFIHGAASVGLDLIKSNPGDASVLPKLQQILSDIHGEVTTEEPEEEAVHPNILCSQCLAMYRNNPPAYQYCLLHCT